MKNLKTTYYFIIALFFLNFMSCCSSKNSLNKKNESVYIENDSSVAAESATPILVDGKKVEKKHGSDESIITEEKEVSDRAVIQEGATANHNNNRNYHTNSFNITRDSVQTPTSSSPENENNNNEDELGTIAYNIPDTMKVGVEYLVRLRISKKMSNSLTFGLGGGNNNNLTVRNIRVGNTMEVKLVETNSSEENFKINSLSSGVQSVEDDSSYTTWEWSVRPVKSGLHKLKMIVVIKGEGFTKDIPVYEDDIYIQSSTRFFVSQFVIKNWQWLAGSIIIPLIVFFWKRKDKKED